MVHGYDKNCDDATQIPELGHIGVRGKKDKNLMLGKANVEKEEKLKKLEEHQKKCRVGGEIIAEVGGADAWRG